MDKTYYSQCFCICLLSVAALLYFSQTYSCLTSVFWIHMRRVEAEVDEEGNRHSKPEPLHHIGGLLAVQGRGHVTPQDHALSSARRHKPGLLSHSVGTWKEKEDVLWQTRHFHVHRSTAGAWHAGKQGAGKSSCTEILQTKQENLISFKSTKTNLQTIIGVALQRDRLN